MPEVTEPDLPALRRCIDRLLQHGCLDVADWPSGGPTAAELGFPVAAGRIGPPPHLDLLESGAVREALTSGTRAWLRELQIDTVTGSTNADLMERGAAGPVAGLVRLAEVQVRGRGRRGRIWLSPFAGSLAFSLGIALQRETGSLGGLSLVVGLAVLDALERLGVDGLSLKWPNDILRNGAKLGGVLIEIVPAVPSRSGSAVVIGVGINVRLPAAIGDVLDQPVSDLGPAAERMSRSRSAGVLISSIREFVEGFDRSGFEPFRAAFDSKHAYHGASCEIIHGSGSTHGVVAGVSGTGGLLLDQRGIREEFHGGEVSLRGRGPAG